MLVLLFNAELESKNHQTVFPVADALRRKTEPIRACKPNKILRNEVACIAGQWRFRRLLSPNGLVIQTRRTFTCAMHSRDTEEMLAGLFNISRAIEQEPPGS